jgi:hypothetical protein
MRFFPSIRTCVIGGALAAGGVWGIGGLAHAQGDQPSTGASPLESAPGLMEQLTQPASQSDVYMQRGLDAQANAADARQRADKLAALGGQTFKTGQVQVAEREATIEQRTAERNFAHAGIPSCQAFTAATPPSSQLQAAEARLHDLRNSGGWAYKSGAVSRAQVDVVEAQPTPQPLPAIRMP